MHGVLDENGEPACQPCAWFYKESGCLNSVPCKYCHLCPQGELKNRKKKKIARLRSEDSAAQEVTGKSQGDFEEPAYVRVPGLELRRSKTAPPAVERRADGEESMQLGLDAGGLLPPPGLDAHMSPIADPSLGLDPAAMGMQLDCCGPVFGSWGAAPWALDPAAAYGYDPQLAFAAAAFPPTPVNPHELVLPMAASAVGLLLPPPPEEPPALLEGGSTALHPPPPPEQSPLGALRHTVDRQPQAPVWGSGSEDADFQMPCGLLPADLQAEIQPSRSALSALAPPWEACPAAPLPERGAGLPPRLERAVSSPLDAPFHGGPDWAGTAGVEMLPPELERAATVPEPPELERAATQTAVRTDEGEDGAFCVSWTVDARKLKASDKVAVSPAFQVPAAPGNFRMMLLPKVVDDRKGGASFKRAKGKGLVQVKCEENLDDPCGGTVALRLSVRSGGPEFDGSERPELPRGPVTHDFAEKGIFCLPKGQEEWDFGKIVNGSQTFVVCLEVLPPSSPSSAAGAGAEAPLGPPPGLGREAWGPLAARAADGTEDDQLPA